MKKSYRVYNCSEINNLHYDAIICGSDQIWNETLTGGLFSLYFGEGIICSRKISYAASNGHNKVLDKIWNDFYRNIKAMDAISIREKGLSLFLKDRGIENTLVLDPIFFLNKEEWGKIAILPKDRDYVLTYSFAETPHFFEKAVEIAKRLHKPLICFSFRKKKISHSAIQVYNKGPREFLGYFNNACYIVTNSFHGTAFSILYQKQFIVIPPMKRRERIDNILDICGINNAVVEDNDSVKCLPVVNYNKVNTILSMQKKQSLNFLLSNLEDIR